MCEGCETTAVNHVREAKYLVNNRRLTSLTHHNLFPSNHSPYMTYLEDVCLPQRIGTKEAGAISDGSVRTGYFPLDQASEGTARSFVARSVDGS